MSSMDAYDVAIGHKCCVCLEMAFGRCHQCYKGICMKHGEPKVVILGVIVPGNLCPECAAKAAKK